MKNENKLKSAKSKDKPGIFDLTWEEWRDFAVQSGEKPFRGQQVYEWIHKKKVYDAGKMHNVNESFRSRIKSEMGERRLKALAVTGEMADETIKVLWQEPGGKRFESVWLRKDGRATACISTQAGCTLNCVFCMSGQVPFTGNLTAGQMVEQVYAMEEMFGEAVTNIVFMGMGEPFYNYDASLKAAHLFHDTRGMNLGSRKITISTAGVLQPLQTYIENREPFNLALSVHTFDPVKRAVLMDVQKRNPLSAILQLLHDNLDRMRQKQVTFEYVMIHDFNISDEDAHLLNRYARQLKARVSLIPLNTDCGELKRPTEQEMEQFSLKSRSSDLQVYNRMSQGLEINAACGMLSASMDDSDEQPENINATVRQKC